MARPQKGGFDYFPLECGFFNNIKIKALRRELGAVGVLTYLNLLCKVFDNGYYLEFQDIKQLSYDIAEEIANDQLAKVSNCVTRSIHYMADNDLLDGFCLEMGVITSRAIQQQYNLMNAKSKRQGVIKKYAISSVMVNVEKITVNAEEMAVNAEEMAVNSEFSTQRKGKESKGKDTKDDVDNISETKDELYHHRIDTLVGLCDNLEVDCELNNNIDLEKLIKAVSESEFLQGFARLSQLVSKYKDIVCGKYKTFKRKEASAPSSKSAHFEGERDYSNEELKGFFGDITNIDNIEI